MVLVEEEPATLEMLSSWWTVLISEISDDIYQKDPGFGVAPVVYGLGQTACVIVILCVLTW